MADVVKFIYAENGELTVKKLSTDQDILEFYTFQKVEELVKLDGFYKPDMLEFTEYSMTTELNSFFKKNGFDFNLVVKFKTETSLEIYDSKTNMQLKMDLQIH